MLVIQIVALIIAIVCWSIFVHMFRKNRSRYRNCYVLFITLIATMMFIVVLPGEEYFIGVFCIMLMALVVFLLVVPFFFIFNGIVMIKREGKHLAHMLSLALGVAILLGEVVTFIQLVIYSEASWETMDKYSNSVVSLLMLIFSMTVIYGSMEFLVFMIYVLFLQVIPKGKNFDYIVIHGAGLLGGDRVSKLLSDRIDKAINIYKKAPNKPKLIPSGGKGDDETISEAEAMKRYLLEKGIPEEDIILEDKSATTYENLKNSKAIIDGRWGSKNTALVTSNYHVYRALRYARKIDLRCTGVGSRVAFYYWPSALIREFIAIQTEKKHALLFVGGWFILASGLYMLWR